MLRLLPLSQVPGMLLEPRPRLAPDSSYASVFCFLCVLTTRTMAYSHGAPFIRYESILKHGEGLKLCTVPLSAC